MPNLGGLYSRNTPPSLRNLSWGSCLSLSPKVAFIKSCFEPHDFWAWTLLFGPHVTWKLLKLLMSWSFITNKILFLIYCYHIKHGPMKPHMKFIFWHQNVQTKKHGVYLVYIGHVWGAMPNHLLKHASWWNICGLIVDVSNSITKIGVWLDWALLVFAYQLQIATLSFEFQDISWCAKIIRFQSEDCLNSNP